MELMNRATVTERDNNYDNPITGLAHLAFSTGNRQCVDSLTETLKIDGLKIVSEPRVTGDGYYESVVLDPENNIIEITE